MGADYFFFIVDDDSSIRNILRIRLNHYFKDPTIFEASSISEGKNFLDSNGSRPTLAFLDQHLPDGKADEIIDHPALSDVPIIAMSSDKTPDLPAKTLKDGARFFITKEQISHAFFLPLVEAILDRSELDKKLKLKSAAELQLKTVKTLIKTLQHEINNPLGALFGASYLLNQKDLTTDDRKSALDLIDQSSKRIKVVLEKLVEATDLTLEEKGKEELYKIPGDKDWK